MVEIVRYSAFADVEDRYRQRYADLAVNAGGASGFPHPCPHCLPHAPIPG